MEFENVNNINLAIEAAAAKKASEKPKRRSTLNLFTSAVHRLKKLWKRAKPTPSCTCGSSTKSEEELDNDLNELLEAKAKAAASTTQQQLHHEHLEKISDLIIFFRQPQSNDLKHFHIITTGQTPEPQASPNQ